MPPFRVNGGEEFSLVCRKIPRGLLRGRSPLSYYRNAFSAVPRSKVKLVAKMLKAIQAQGSKKAAREKAKAVVTQ